MSSFKTKAQLLKAQLSEEHSEQAQQQQVQIIRDCKH